MSRQERREEFNGLIIDDVQSFDEDLITHDLCVTGSALLSEDLEADYVQVPGRLDVNGMISCDELEVTGRVKCKAGVVIETGEVQGKLTSSGKINAESLNVTGTLACRASVKAYDVNVPGELSCVGKLKSEKINVTGKLRVDGSLSAMRLSVDSPAASYVDEISVDRLIVRKTGGEEDYALRCSDADCRTANIAYTRIGSLSCSAAEIGPGCKIDELIYSGSVSISPEAIVRKVIKL